MIHYLRCIHGDAQAAYGFLKGRPRQRNNACHVVPRHEVLFYFSIQEAGMAQSALTVI